MKVHPDAGILPAMTPDEFERLADDIAANGLLEPITTLDGMILDGRHRFRACEERGVEIRSSKWDPSCGVTPLEWMVSVNLQRRQLTTAQRTALAVELEPRLAEAARERKVRAGSEAGKKAGRGRPIGSESKEHDPIETRKESSRSADIAARTFGVGGATVVRLKAVKKKDPDVFERAKQGEISVGKASRLAGLPPSNSPARHTKTKLKEVLDPLRRYLKNWDEERLHGISPKEAKRLLKVVQEIDQTLFEVERALEERAVVSRALQ